MKNNSLNPSKNRNLARIDADILKDDFKSVEERSQLYAGQAQKIPLEVKNNNGINITDRKRMIVNNQTEIRKKVLRVIEF